MNAPNPAQLKGRSAKGQAANEENMSEHLQNIADR
jgi:hypothetical protein